MKLYLPVLGVLSFLTITLLTGPAIAHENREAGQYGIGEVGWISEPPYAGMKNAVHFNVEKKVEGNMSMKDEHTGVAGLEKTLEVTLSTGGKATKFQLRPVTESEPGHEESGPGNYLAEIIPTRSGTYTLAMKGTIEGVQVNEIFTLEEVRSLGELQFPEADPVPADLQKSLDSVNSKVDRLSSNSSMWSIGLVTGTLGLLIGTVALVVALRKK